MHTTRILLLIVLKYINPWFSNLLSSILKAVMQILLEDSLEIKMTPLYVCWHEYLSYNEKSCQIKWIYDGSLMVVIKVGLYAVLYMI